MSGDAEAAGAGDSFWRTMFDAMPQLGWTAQPDGFIDHYNRGWFDFTGTTPAQMEGWGWRAVHHPDHLERVEQTWRAAIAAGVSVEFEFPLRRHDGVFRWFLTRVNPVRDGAGRVLRWVGINTDVDDLQRAHLELRALNARAEAARQALDLQRSRYQLVFAQAPVAIALFSGPRLTIELVNPMMCAQWGRNVDDLLGKTMVEAMPELDAQGFGALLEQVRDTGIPFVGNEVEGQLARGPGGALETGYFNFVYQPLRGDDGRVDDVVGVATDVTPQVLARRQVQETARLARFGADVGAALTTASTLREQLQGCCAAMVTLGGLFARVWTLHEHEAVLELQASAGQSTRLDSEHARVPVGHHTIGRIAAERAPHVTNDVQHDPLIGDPAWAAREGVVSFAGYPLLVGDKLVGVMALFAREPLSDDVLLALRSVATPVGLAIASDRSERFRELFIGMLGHDLRNPLSAIMTGVQAIALQPEATEKTTRSVGRVLHSASRMARMVTQLLDYTRARSGGGIPVAPVPGDLFAIATEVTDEAARAHPTRVVDVVVHGDGHGDFDADRMAQVFSNLIGNAISYSDPLQPVRVVLDGRRPVITCEVRSQGAPIDPALLPFIFELFRSGRRGASSGGLGLGLFITREIILSHHGAITATSSADDGTSFSFAVPRTQAPAGPPRTAGTTP